MLAIDPDPLPLPRLFRSQPPLDLVEAFQHGRRHLLITFRGHFHIGHAEDVDARGVGGLDAGLAVLQNQTVRRGGVGFFGSLQENIRARACRARSRCQRPCRQNTARRPAGSAPRRRAPARWRLPAPRPRPRFSARTAGPPRRLELHILQQLLFPGNLPGQALLHRDGQIVPAMTFVMLATPVLPL